jgi:hypothetical protein
MRSPDFVAASIRSTTASGVTLFRMTWRMDALRRVVDAAVVFGCVGIAVDAKDEAAESFYLAYGFAGIAGADWPRRMLARNSQCRSHLLNTVSCAPSFTSANAR